MKVSPISYAILLALFGLVNTATAAAPYEYVIDMSGATATLGGATWHSDHGLSNATRIIDGHHESGGAIWNQHAVSYDIASCDTTPVGYAEVDLKQTSMLKGVRFYLYYGDDRKYCHVKLQVKASSGDIYETVYTTGTAYTPITSENGQTVTFAQLKPVQFIRLYVGPNDKYKSAHIIEIEPLALHTDAPTSTPSSSPSDKPSSSPSSAPSKTPSSSPITTAPTQAPTDAPTGTTVATTQAPGPAPCVDSTQSMCISPDVCKNKVIAENACRKYCGICKDDSGGTTKNAKASTATSGGDPHFATWSGTKFDFHGECDLVLFSAPHFANGLGLDIHIRTKIDDWWSYIDTAAIRVGEHTLEITGGKQQIPYWLDGVKVADIKTGNAMLDWFPIHFRRVSKIQSITRIDLGNGSALSIETYKRFVRVSIRPNGAFVGSYGMLGSYPGGQKMARDKVTVIEDANDFGQEWQVLDVEPKLFHNVSNVQHPKKCLMPPHDQASIKKRRLGESLISKEDAELACGGQVYRQEDFPDCVFDVLATNDKSIAESYNIPGAH